MRSRANPVAAFVILGAALMAATRVSAQDAADVATPAAATVHFSLDSSAVSLAAVSWRFRAGDDLSWAEPDFDDSDWHLISRQSDSGLLLVG